jgi:opacity protein-like surface antigen
MGCRSWCAAAIAMFTLGLGAPLAASAAQPADDTGAIHEEIDELERKLEILTEELRKLKESEVLPEKAELKSSYGLGPAASKVYTKERGLSIGGYGEFNLKTLVDDSGGNDDVFDLLRFVLYFGYKFNDWIVFNSEVEFEHASTEDDGAVSVEFAYLDFLLHEHVNLRAGLLLMPVGFINEQHEPPFFHGNVRPAVETQIIPSTWRANGGGIFGEIVPGLNYRMYAVTSLRADRFESDNFREGRQDGSEELAHDFSWVGRLDYTPTPGLELGFSAYLGNQGQNADFVTARDVDGNPITTTKADAFMQLYEGHVQWHYRGLELRGLAAFVDLDDARVISLDRQETVADQMLGYYGEIAYDVMPHILPDSDQYLAPWFRYSAYDTQHHVPSGFAADERQDRQAFEVGLSYKPTPRVVVKLDYRNLDAKRGSQPDEVRLGAGFEF